MFQCAVSTPSWLSSSADVSCFALLGEPLLAVVGMPNHPKGAKRACPCIRVPRCGTPLAPSSFQGPALTGHPWPGSALATSMSLNPFHDDFARPPEGAAFPASPFSTRHESRVRSKIAHRARAGRRSGSRTAEQNVVACPFQRRVRATAPTESDTTHGRSCPVHSG